MPLIHCERAEPLTVLSTWMDLDFLKHLTAQDIFTVPKAGHYNEMFPDL